MMKVLWGAVLGFFATACGDKTPTSVTMDVSIGRGIANVVIDLRNFEDVRFIVEDQEGSTYPVVHEFDGALEYSAEDKSLSWKSSGESLIIGFLAESNVSICNGEYSQVCDLSIGRKAADESNIDGQAIYSANLSKTAISDELSLSDSGIPSRMSELNRFVLPSPDQDEAGSCLYMASTGAMEVLLNKNATTRDLRSEGRADLSERYLMNAGAKKSLDYWLTDTILVFNQTGGGVLNRDYRYTKGWFKSTQSGTVPASRNAQGAEYGTKYNWINGLTPTVESSAISLPTVKRRIIYKDPDQNQWNTGIMQPDTITKIKTHLATKKTPVLFVYNHFGYWHAVAIVGYDDTKEHGSCPFVNSFIKEMSKSKGQAEYIRKIENSKKTYGCSTKGVFYVRDSIYAGDKSNMYDYDLTTTGDESPYTKPIVEHEYEWALYLGNHAYTIEL